MKNTRSFIFGLGIVCLSVFLSYFWTVTAQRTARTQWEYAAVNVTFISETPENQTTVTGVANICYIQNDGCRNEEIRAEITTAKVLQEVRLENKENSNDFIFSRAREIAFARAVVKLGNDGWEMIGQTPFEFDAVTINRQGNNNFWQGSKTLQPDLYFKRIKQ